MVENLSGNSDDGDGITENHVRKFTRQMHDEAVPPARKVAELVDFSLRKGSSLTPFGSEELHKQLDDAVTGSLCKSAPSSCARRTTDDVSGNGGFEEISDGDVKKLARGMQIQGVPPEQQIAEFADFSLRNGASLTLYGDEELSRQLNNAVSESLDKPHPRAVTEKTVDEFAMGMTKGNMSPSRQIIELINHGYQNASRITPDGQERLIEQLNYAVVRSLYNEG